jgi:hypothetical protein
VNWDAHIDATAALIALPVAPERRAGVARFLELAAEMAATLDRVELDDGGLDLAPVFAPPDLAGGAR